MQMCYNNKKTKEMSIMADSITFPKIPVSNWYDIRKQFQKTLPTVVSQTYLQSLLKLSNIQSAQNLIPPLKSMGLIDEDNKPTDLANKWRNDSTYIEACKEIFERVYPEELRQLFIGNDIDKEALTMWFMSTTKCGKASAKLFSLTFMCLSNPSLEPPAKNLNKAMTTNKPVKKTSKEPKKDVKSLDAVSVEESTEEKPIISGKRQQPTVHIDLQIHISPDSSVEQVDAIFASIAKHLYDK